MNYEKKGLGEEILRASINELYMNFPYMDVALCALAIKEAPEVTLSIATDGNLLCFNPRWINGSYLKGRNFVNRAYMHSIFHCLLHHIWKSKGKDNVLWDLACDVAVGNLMLDLNYPCIQTNYEPGAVKFINECAQEMKVITAENVYHKLTHMSLEKRQLDILRRTFVVDDHKLWEQTTDDSGRKDSDRDAPDGEEKWDNISNRAMSMMKQMFNQPSNSRQSIMNTIQVGLKEPADYRSFLRKFATAREVQEVDVDSFDYIYYTYGLDIYGNMPLVEPLETKEEKRIEDLVIAVDTSMSTSGETVKAFLSATYALLRNTETYTRKVNIHIIQCDNKVRSDKKINNLDELHDYMKNFDLQGGDSTDFRPVFQHVNQLIKQGEFSYLKGLIYFTDGLGFYPEKRPDYDTAFVFLGEPPETIRIPHWAIKLILDTSDIKKTLEQAYEEEPEMIDWEELPRT